jgi:hypothetical protein
MILLTDLIQHLVTLIKDENLDTTKTQVLVSYELVHTTGRCDDDMWVSILVLENLGIFYNGGSTVEDRGLHVRHILAEPSVFVLDLIRKFAGVTHDKDGGFASYRLHLLKGGEDEDSGLTKTRFSLAEDIGTEDSLRNGQLLDCRVNRADVRSIFLQVYNKVQEIATSVHLRGVESTKQHPPHEIYYRSRGTTMPLKAAIDQSA